VGGGQAIVENKVAMSRMGSVERIEMNDQGCLLIVFAAFRDCF
jgi:hypothetical protein